ncbi:hypothetical protein L248_2854 [Schleiferilactobacillus shenzhenensis LY-73]|uniref:Uncharacterized protein n=2 Tax=Schleiferilactobacillus shenzhenensis TaxID=1231337 RepID=U4TLT0_9LACO|nr:hypothetical protein L248_2854 [Schleiferilactobacillus shenzhenensis LY-73]
MPHNRTDQHNAQIHNRFDGIAKHVTNTKRLNHDVRMSLQEVIGDLAQPHLARAKTATDLNRILGIVPGRIK